MEFSSEKGMTTRQLTRLMRAMRQAAHEPHTPVTVHIDRYYSIMVETLL